MKVCVLSALAFVGGCAELPDPPPFVYEAHFMPLGVTIAIDGVVNPEMVTASFASYEHAQLMFSRLVTVTDGATGLSKDFEVRPGYCQDVVFPKYGEIGPLLFERVLFWAYPGAPEPTLFPGAPFDCLSPERAFGGDY